jgi:hypothetical protein
VVFRGARRAGEAGRLRHFAPGGEYAVITQTLSGFEHHHIMEIVGSDGSIRTWWSGAEDRTRHPTFELKVKQDGAERAETITLGASGELFELDEELRPVFGRADRSSRARRRAGASSAVSPPSARSPKTARSRSISRLVRCETGAPHERRVRSPAP